MRANKGMTVRGAAVMAAVWLAAGVGAAGQQGAPQPRVERQVNVTVLRSGDAGPDGALPMADLDVDFAAMPLAMGGETVADAPYSGEAVTEVVQSLADGNRIQRTSRAAVARDRAGRTRRELGLSVIGQAVGGASGEPRTQVQIHDPQANAIYLLDAATHTAHRLPAPRLSLMGPGDNGPGRRTAAVVGGPGGVGAPGGGTIEDQTFDVRLPGAPGDAGAAVFFRRRTSGDAPGMSVESLGHRMIEGVDAEGTRSTMTIAAGRIGNELPITVVSERWFSPELKVLVLSRQTDPRFGETTYRLTNISRADPPPDLFQVPGDYKLVGPAFDLGGAAGAR